MDAAHNQFTLAEVCLEAEEVEAIVLGVRYLLKYEHITWMLTGLIKSRVLMKRQ